MGRWIAASNWDNLPAFDRATDDEPAYHTRCDRCGAEICMRGDACNLGDTGRGPGVADSVDPDVRLCATGACAAACEAKARKAWTAMPRC